jgi:ribosome-binding protein aMBF1 (putative translation factor)
MKGLESRVRLRVAEVARERKLSDLELAHLSSVGVSVIRRMFTSSGNVYLTQLAKVAAALDVKVCELIDEQTKEAKDGKMTE